MKNIIDKIVKRKPIIGTIVTTLIFWLVGIFVPAVFIRVCGISRIVLLSGGLVFYAFISFVLVGNLLYGDSNERCASKPVRICVYSIPLLAFLSVLVHKRWPNFAIAGWSIVLALSAVVTVSATLCAVRGWLKWARRTGKE